MGSAAAAFMDGPAVESPARGRPLVTACYEAIDRYHLTERRADSRHHPDLDRRISARAPRHAQCWVRRSMSSVARLGSSS